MTTDEERRARNLRDYADRVDSLADWAKERDLHPAIRGVYLERAAEIRARADKLDPPMVAS